MNEDEFKAHEIKVTIPDAAPSGVVDLVMDSVCRLMDHLEDAEPLIRDRVGWDYYVDSSPADHRLEAAFSRLVEENHRLKKMLGGT